MLEDLLDHRRVFDTGKALDGAAAFTAGIDVDVEHPFEALRLGHGCTPFQGSWRFICCLGLLANFTPPRRCYQGAVLAVRRKYPVKPGQVDAWFGHQGGQSCDEIQRLEFDMLGPVTVRRLEPTANATPPR